MKYSGLKNFCEVGMNQPCESKKEMIPSYLVLQVISYRYCFMIIILNNEPL